MKVDSEMGVVAASPIGFTINGKQVAMAPLTIGDWGTLERIALKMYQDSQIETYTRNIHLMPADMQQKELREVFRRTSELTAAALPKQEMLVYDRDEIGNVRRDSEGNPREVVKPIEYIRWWLTTMEGKRQSVYLSMRRANPAVTMNDLDTMFADAGRSALHDAADTVSELSEPQLKN